MELASRHRDIVSRSRHTNLRPLATGVDVRRNTPPTFDLQTQLSGQSKTSVSPASAISLASPSLMAVRQYYIDHGLRTAFQETSPEHHQNLQPQQNFPRRHSLLSPGLINRLGNVKVSTPVNASPLIKQAPENESLADTSRQMLLKGINNNELARLGGVVTRRRSILQHPNPGKIPTAYTHDRLREWGVVYLGNTDTADVFVKALHLRKSEQAVDGKPIKQEVESNLEFINSERSIEALLSKSSDPDDEIVIRARVTPRAKERKPFLIQRRFNIKKLQANVAASKSPMMHQDSDAKSVSVLVSGLNEPDIKVIQTRSHSTPSSPPRYGSQEIKTHAKSPATISSSRRSSTSFDRRAMPIHVEYALHYLPILAALMLSGHVRKGDAIDLPLPHPEGWRDTVSYIYTGKGEVTMAMKANLQYLAGSVDLSPMEPLSHAKS